MLETKRCVLVEVHERDEKEIQRLYEDEECRRYLGGRVSERKFKENFQQLIQSPEAKTYWVVREKETHAFVGVISLDTHHDGIHTELSYQLLPKWWGKGYASELISDVIHSSFTQMNLTTLVSETQVANGASCRVLEKAGMRAIQTLQRFGEEQVIYRIDKS